MSTSKPLVPKYLNTVQLPVGHSLEGFDCIVTPSSVYIAYRSILEIVRCPGTRF